MPKVLVRRQPGPEQRRRIALAILIVALYTVAILALMRLSDDPSWLLRVVASLHVDWRKALAHNWPLLVYGAALAIYLPLLRRYQREARLILDDAGVAHRGGMPPLLAKLPIGFGDWYLRWDDVTKIRYDRLRGSLRVRTKKALPLILRPLEWSDAAASDGETWRLYHPDPVQGSPLWRELETRGLFRRTGVNFDSGLSFELDAHPATVWAIFIGVVLTLYGLADGLLNIDESYLHDDGNYWHLLPAVAVGLGIGALTTTVLRLVRTPARVPWSTALGMGLLLAIAGTLAGSAAMLRVNQHYGGQLLPEPYRRASDCMTLVPRNPALAILRFNSSTGKHWCSFAPDQDIPVPVRKGLFGTYQARLVGLVDATMPPHHERAAPGH